MALEQDLIEHSSANIMMHNIDPPSTFSRPIYSIIISSPFDTKPDRHHETTTNRKSVKN